MTFARPRLGIDFGTSNTVAFLSRGDGTVTPLLFDASPLLASAVFAGPDGRLLTGADAARAATGRPAAYEPNPKQRIDEATVWLDDRAFAVHEVIAAVLRRVLDEARRVAGADPADVVLTYPAGWSRTRLTVLAAAADRAALGNVRFVREPVAAAAYFAAVLGQELGPRRCLVVYDFGAGTFDVAVVRRASDGVEVLAAEGLTDVGGNDLDAVVVDHLRSLTPDTAAWGRLDWPETPTDQRARRALWNDARAAKEQLTRHPSADVHVPIVERTLHITRDEFDTAARPYLERTVALTMATLRAAGVGREAIGGILLVGGSSRLPLAASLLHRTLRLAPTVMEQPELVVAHGGLHVPADTETLGPLPPPPPPPAAAADTLDTADTLTISAAPPAPATPLVAAAPAAPATAPPASTATPPTLAATPPASPARPSAPAGPGRPAPAEPGGMEPRTETAAPGDEALPVHASTSIGLDHTTPRAAATDAAPATSSPLPGPSEPELGSPAVDAPAPAAPESPRSAVGGRRAPLIAGVAVLALLALVVLLVVRPWARDSDRGSSASGSSSGSGASGGASSAAIASPGVVPSGGGQAKSFGGGMLGTALTTDGRRAYFRRAGSDTVTVVNVPSRTAIGSIRVDGSPWSVAVRPQSDRAYVADGEGAVAVIDTATAHVTATIPVGGRPVGIVVRPDGTRAYVAMDNAVVVIDTGTNTVATTVSTGAQTFGGLAVSPDGAKLVVATFRGITVIDTLANTVVNKIDTVGKGMAARGVAFTSDGARAVVTNSIGSTTETHGTVSLVDIASATVVGTVDVGQLPSDVAIGPGDRQAFVLHGYNGKISIVDLASRTLAREIDLGQRYAQGMALLPDGRTAFVPFGEKFTTVDLGTA